MEERGGTRRMTQQRFDLAERPADPSQEVAARPPETVPPPAVPPLPIPREPSDIDLRERQMRWVRARLRFEADRKPTEPREGSK
jgi:hypothetical protein